MNKKRALEIVEKLKEIYPAAECALNFEGDPWKLLVLARLSAQCTDNRVNMIAPALFAAFPTPEAMADAELSEIEEKIKSCGLYRSKAANLKDACRMLIDRFGGRVPDNMEQLLELPGVGRKIANLLLGDIYKKPAVVVDTHCIRLAGRLGFCSKKEKNPLRIERILEKYIPAEERSDFCHRIVLFGREYCPARNNDCKECPLSHLCESGK